MARILFPWWKDLCVRLHITEGVGGMFDTVSSRYEEPARHFYTPTFILQGLKTLDDVRRQCVDHNVVELAWFLHRLVAEPDAQDNAERSIEAAKPVLAWFGQSRAFNGAVERCISATHVYSGSCSDACITADLEKSYLGQRYVLFRELEDGLRSEHHNVPDSVYYDRDRGRPHQMREWLTREHLFLHPYFQGRFRRPAEENIRRWLGQHVC